jgi:hypothetical protein
MLMIEFWAFPSLITGQYFLLNSQISKLVVSHTEGNLLIPESGRVLAAYCWGVSRAQESLACEKFLRHRLFPPQG